MMINSNLNDRVNELYGIKLTEFHRLSFAKMILLWLAILFIISMATRIFTHDNVIFDACKTILPPIATLVIGYYFGKKADD